jgi:hypothetical protein
VRHRLRCGQGLRVYAFEVEVELSIGVERLQLLSEFQGEDGLADAACATEAEDRTGAALGESGAECFEILLAAGEVGGWGGELVESGESRGALQVDDLDSSAGRSDEISTALYFLECGRSPRSYAGGSAFGWGSLVTLMVS